MLTIDPEPLPVAFFKSPTSEPGSVLFNSSDNRPVRVYFQEALRFSMQIHQSKINDAIVLELSGRLNSQTSGDLEKVVDRVTANGARRLVFGCEGLEYCSSAGLRVFLTSVKLQKSLGGRCVFAALSPAVREVFEIAGFPEVFEIRPTIAEAAA